MAKKILLIDDDPGILEPLRRLLTLCGFEVFLAETAREGLESLDGKDIAVVDLHLPDELGTSVLNKIRQENRPIRAAIFTADPDAARQIAPDIHPFAIFCKMEVDRLLTWIGQP
jgi:DNA-binding response OmpR family regulator